MPEDALTSALEALLLAAGEPVSSGALAEALQVSAQEVQTALQDLQEHYQQQHGIKVVAVANGYQLRTCSQWGELVRRFKGQRRQRLSRAAVETLAIIAYQAPVTRAQIEQLRGVDSSGVLRFLRQRGLIQIRGRQEVAGRPRLYAPTEGFWSLFGLQGSQDLPRWETLQAQVEELFYRESAPESSGIL